MKAWWCLKIFLLFFLIIPQLSFAFISVPYVTDSKSQVVASDSVEIVYKDKTYYGLENYNQEYVNGFARFSFTYTHHSCCFDNFPPIIYITQQDPTIPVLGGVYGATYQLYQMNHGSGNETDLYFYSIQFDATGYTVLVTNSSGVPAENRHYDIPELTAESYASLANRHTRSDPPGPGSYSFPPVRIKKLASLNPVIVIPDIAGSVEKNGVWIMDPVLQVYDNLLSTLESNGYVKDANLFTFPYEWRDSNIFTATKLKERIDQVKTECLATKPEDTDCSKVDLVAHSMGGLVARYYVESSFYENDIDQLIFLDTPHRGSAKANLVWENGEFGAGLKDLLAQRILIFEAQSDGYEDVLNYIHSRPVSSIEEVLPIGNSPDNNFLENLNDGLPFLINSGIRIANLLGNGEGSGLVEAIVDEKFENVDSDDLPSVAAGKIFNILTLKEANSVASAPRPKNILLLELKNSQDLSVSRPDGKMAGKNFDTALEYGEIQGVFYTAPTAASVYLALPDASDGVYQVILKPKEGSIPYHITASFLTNGGTDLTEHTDTMAAGEAVVLKLELKEGRVSFVFDPVQAPIASAPSSGGGGLSGSHRRPLPEVLGASTSALAIEYPIAPVSVSLHKPIAVEPRSAIASTPASSSAVLATTSVASIEKYDYVPEKSKPNNQVAIAFESNWKEDLSPIGWAFWLALLLVIVIFMTRQRRAERLEIEQGRAWFV